MKKRFAALMMSVIMLATMLPMSVVSASPVVPKAFEDTTILHNDNQGDGAVLVKFAQPHLDENGVPDGTVDIVIQAHTTGQVHKNDVVVPTDIVLVLDLSGSMDTVEGEVTREVYTEIDATSTRYGNSTYYTLSTTSSIYRKNDDGTYTRLRNSSYDRNGYQYFRSGNTYVYPELADGVTPARERQYDYDVEQLYVLTTEVVTEATSRISLLKEAVDTFIASTADYNETLDDEADMHRIALVKFATADYYNDNNLTAEGDNKNGSGYNYSQVVKNFTTVYGDGETELTDAMDALKSGGATAVDYGMNLANALFEAAEGTEAAEGRKKVVVVVTDGSPTHNNSYSASVAGAAINHANTLKSENVTIYTISVAAGADGTQLGSDNTNRFMHYLSSNYPSASYANGTITAGTGSPAGGYYLTPDTANNLSMIFERISTEIGEPTVELGEEAVLVDTVSEFFTIPAGTNSVTVATADKTATGWKDAVKSNLVPTFTDDNTVVTVKGFNFDENYVSVEPREVDGEEFYGRMLILYINVTPNTATIDTHAAEIAANGGLVPTNDGTAEIMSGTNVVAAVDSPTVQLNKITYTVKDNPQFNATYYRLAGMSHTIIANPTREGHTFSGWTVTDADITVDNGAFTMPANDVEIKGSFTVNTHKVIYKFVGLEVYDEDDLPKDNNNYAYGTTVTVADKPEINGYNFIGWYPQDEALGTGNIESFSMPDHDVVLLGRFVPDTDTAYTVEHYTENLDGTFKLEVEDTENLSGTTGETAVAAPKSYVGFTYDAAYDDGTYKTIASGVIDANGELVLKLYYVRNEWTLTYEYVGTVPGGAVPSESDLETLAEYNVTKKYGEEVRIEEDASASGYTFTGWYSLGGTVQPTTESFEMPDHDVTLHGYFTARTDVVYKVEHYFENTDGDYVIDESKTETFTNATMGTTVSATPLNVQYYTFDSDNGDNVLSAEVKGDGSLVLKVYYERTSYTVTYDYEGTVPAAAEPARSELASIGGTYKWGDEVPLTDVVPTATDHVFHGWYYIGANGRTDMPATFEMPKANVLILGHFDPTTGLKYYVEHYFINDEGQYVHNDAYNEEFTGNAGQTVSATAVDVEGYKYNEEYSEPTASGEIPLEEDGTLTLKLYYDYDKFIVKYLYEGLVPTGASELPADKEWEYRSTVTVELDASAPGYAFEGWYRNNDASKTEITSFTMPAHTVELAGRFTARNDTPYIVEHYLETAEDGVYAEVPFATEKLTGTTGTEVSATPKGVEYYTYNPQKSAATRTDVIKGDGSTVLKLYYDRNTYAVTYVYTTAPADAVLPTDTNKYAHGAEVTVENATDVAGYSFSGWSANGITVTGGTILGGGEFTMPTGNVVFVGSYTAKEATYTVEHWVQNPENTDEYVLHGTPEVRQGVTDQSVTAASHVIHGYTYSPDVTESKIPSGSGITFVDGTNGTVLKGTVDYDGTLTLSFYYTVDEYDVTYVIEGTAPSEAVKPDDATYNFGESVEVHEGYDIPGYEFSGWKIGDDIVTGTEFSMPANDVKIKGSFTPVDAEYTIKYWQQVLEGTGTKEHNDKYYDEVVADRVEGLTAITGHYVSAYPDYIKTYEGFIATPEDNDEYYGHVLGDGSLVLNLYYDRLTYSITYVYAGTAPEGVEIPDSYNKESVMYGATVGVEPKLDDYDGFEFNGWHSNSVNVSGGATEFTMPAKNVVLYGRHDAEYTVTYYVDGNRYEEFTVIPGEVHDIIGKPEGTGNFSGWSDPLNVKEGKSFSADDNDFIMPWSDVEIKGKFTIVIPIIPRGTLKISKVVEAPDNFTGSDEYTFEIYRISAGEETFVETVTVKAGQSVSLRTTPGEYKVVEVNADVDGFTRNTVCNVDTATVDVINSETTEITFTNIYAPVMLEKDDHFGYIIGYPDGTVRPEADITRAEVVTIFFRMFTDSARDYYWNESNDFTDVADTDWYNLAISTLANAGVLDGYTDGTFRPNETITRAELIKIASSFYDTAAGKESQFSDIAAHWAEKFIEEAYKLGIVEGYGDGTFHPDEPVTRAEAMKIVNRTLERAPHKDGLLDNMIKWPDNADTEKWYYADVQEATNSHEYDFSGEYEVWTALRPMRDWAELELGWREEHEGE